MRNMSFALTVPQLLDGTKDVTRRLKWTVLERGMKLCAVRKSMGLKLGEKIDRLAEIEVVDVSREILRTITEREVRREGFPRMTRDDFIHMFCEANNIGPHTMITRIEFRVVRYLHRRGQLDMFNTPRGAA